MKRIVLTMILFSALSAFAEHEYIPYVQEGNAWVFLNSVQMGAFQYSIGEKQEIDGKQYHLIYETFYYGMTGLHQSPKEYGYIYEEDEKVYLGTGENSLLVYDFSLQKGDSVLWGTYPAVGTPTAEKYIYVKDVDYKQIAGKERKVLYVQTHGKPFVEGAPECKFDEIWIEGIGSTFDVFTGEVFRWDSELVGHYNIFAYYYNYPTQTSYPDNATLYDFGTTMTKKTKVDFSTLTLHRNGNVLMAVFPAAVEGEAITLYDTTGRMVAHQSIREGATTTSIDIAALPSGVYIARLANGATAKVML